MFVSMPTEFKSGSIITEFFILTNAWDTVDAIKIKISFGSPTRAAWATAYYIHPNYHGVVPIENDVALIRLPYSMVWTDMLAPIRLLSRSQASSLFVGADAHYSGFEGEFRIVFLIIVNN